MSVLITFGDMRAQVLVTLGDHVNDFDVDALVEDLHSTYGRVDVDTIPPADYWGIVKRHDTAFRHVA